MKITSLVIAAIVGIAVVASPASAKGSKNLVLLLEGSNVQGYPSTVADIDGDGVDDGAFCLILNCWMPPPTVLWAQPPSAFPRLVRTSRTMQLRLLTYLAARLLHAAR